MSSGSRVFAEFLGSFFLLLIIVGSGIMGEALSAGNPGIALLANSLATGAGLFVLVHCMSPISGAHFNPMVSLLEWRMGRLPLRDLTLYSAAQFSGALLGVLGAHAIFNLSLVQIASKSRSGIHLAISEIIATFGLMATIALSRKKNPDLAPWSIAAYVTSAYWFTSSTSFANPAVTLARSLTNTFCGILPGDVPAFIAAQVTGTVLAYLIFRRF